MDLSLIPIVVIIIYLLSSIKILGSAACLASRKDRA